MNGRRKLIFTIMGIVATVSLLFVSGPLSGNRAVAYGGYGDYPSYGGFGGYGNYPSYGVYCSYADYKSNVLTYGDCFDY